MFRRCVPRGALEQRPLRPSIPITTTSAFVRIRSATQFSSSATTAQQLGLPKEDAQSGGAARLPLSVQAIYHKPLHRTPQYGLPVCNLDIQSYSVRQLEAQCDFALRAAYYLNLPASGTFPRPNKIERWTVPRSNFVHKKSQENYERITHKRLIQIKDGHPETIELWLAFLKKNAIYGVGMRAHVWAFEELSAGKQTNISLENLHDARRPKWAHFGSRKTAQTAAMVRELLESEKFKILEAETATKTGRPNDVAQKLPIMPNLEKSPKIFKKINPKATDDELRFQELQVEVGHKHSKEYLDTAIEGQRTATDKRANTRKGSKSESQPLSEPKSKPSQKVREDRKEVKSVSNARDEHHKETKSVSDAREEHRRETDRLMGLELKRALEAKEAAEAKAAEESRRTAEFQASLLAQFAAMQAELAALKAERVTLKTSEPAPTSTTPVAPKEAKAVETPAEAVPSPVTSPENHAKATAKEQTSFSEPVAEPIPANTSTEPAEELTAAPEAPTFDSRAAKTIRNSPLLDGTMLTKDATASETPASPIADSTVSEVISTEPTPASNIIDPGEKPIPANTAYQPIAAPEARIMENTVETSSPWPEEPELASKQGRPLSAEAALPSAILAEETQEDTIPITASEELEPIAYESADSIGAVENQGDFVAAKEELSSTSIAAEESSAVSQSQSEPEPVEAQPKQHPEQPEGRAVNENSPLDEIPPSVELPESPDAVKRQPEVTRYEEPEPEKHEKPEEVKDEEESR